MQACAAPGDARGAVLPPSWRSSASNASALFQRSVIVSWSSTGPAKPASTSMSPRSCMSMKAGVGVGQPLAAYSSRNSRSVPGPRHDRTATPSTSSRRCQRANSAGGSTIRCSAMLAQTSCARPISASLALSSATVDRVAPNDHHGRRSAARRRAAHVASGSTAIRSARGYAARTTSSPPPGPGHHSTMRRGSMRIGARRSSRRRAISPCSQGSASARARRASAARAATGSTPRAVLRSLAAIAAQYIDAMLATRWARADALGAAIALRGPSLCAVCRSWGRGRVCAACLARFAARVPRCARCALPANAATPVCGSLPDRCAAVRRRARRARLSPRHGTGW